IVDCKMVKLINKKQEFKNPTSDGYGVYTSPLDFVFGCFTPPTPPYKGGAFSCSLPFIREGLGWGKGTMQ
ncbi:hypothetical protein C7B77_28045, partial [Chamaesiphon polymorphus CCALA 037]